MPNRILVCRPTYFDVSYAGNTWMKPGVKIDKEKALQQHDNLLNVLRSYGAEIEFIAPVKGLEDMVFTANAGFLHNGIFVPRTWVRFFNEVFSCDGKNLPPPPLFLKEGGFQNSLS